MGRIRTQFALTLFLCFTFVEAAAVAQGRITSPKEQFGFQIGDDYQLANYAQLADYWRKLARESDRMSLVEIGRTAEGRPMLMAIVTDAANHQNLARYKQIARQLALAEGLTDDQARALAAEGRAVVWIDGGLHATEVLGAQQLIETVYQMVSRNDPETLRLLRDVILLAVIANPDGMDLVSDWYMRESEPTRRSTANIPRLYQKYVGHDNNRDFYLSSQPETRAINRVFYLEWFPQIVYNHHQTGPAGTVLFAPPFRDPFNYRFDPLIPVGIDLVGAAMHGRFAAEGKPGSTMRSGAGYSTWWNGGLRTTVYFHNMIGLLTETIGHPTPMTIPFIPRRQLPSIDLPAPIAPQKWHFKQSVEYSVTANRAVLDVASRYREVFLFNIYRMGKNSIERGSRDHWTTYPRRIADVEEAIARERGSSGREAGDPERRGRFRPGPDSLKFYDMLSDPGQRDPRGFILPSDQADFLTATKFVNALIKTGAAVHRATRSFEVAGKRYPEGSFVVKAAQAFRPHVLDMFEPQDHPDDFTYPGGPPRPPYDSAGWTLAYQMGVQFDRILDGFDGPFERIDGLAAPPPGRVSPVSNPAGYLLSHQVNDAFVAVNRLLAGGEEVYWVQQPFTANGKPWPAGTMFVPAKGSTLPKLEKWASEIGLSFDGISSRPAGSLFRLKPVRIGLWDRYGGSMPSGWVRWLLEQFEFPFEVVFPPTLDAGNLKDRFDVLIFVGGAIPAARQSSTEDPSEGDVPERRFGREPDPDSIPQEYRHMLGRVTAEQTVPQLLRFLEDGGTVLTIGSSTNLAAHAGLPLGNALTERRPDGSERPLGRDAFYVPGSVLQVRVDNSNPLAYGMKEQVDVFFDNNPVFRLEPAAALKGVRPVAWFEGKQVLRSGWAWGASYLDQGIAVVEAPVGKGKLLLFGPEITFRAQPHGTFKFLFNGIYYGAAESVTW